MNLSWFPEAVRPRSYSPLSDWRLNRWMLVALCTDLLLNRWLLPRHGDWSGALRAALALAPLVPSLLWARSLARWIRGLDEMQRRIQLGGWMAAGMGTVFVMTAINLLELARVLPTHGFGWAGTYVVMVLCYVAGMIAANRRFR